MTRLRTRDEMAGWSRRARLARGLGPERIATILSVVVVAAAAGVVLGGPAGPDATASPGASAVPPASAAPSPGGPSASVPPTIAPWASTASALIETHRRMIDARDRLAASLADGESTSEIARELRGLNTLLTGALGVTDALAAAGAPPQLLDDVRTMHQDALDTNLETLQASLQNAPAYRAGANDVIATLADLEALMDRLAAASGLPPPLPSARPS